MLSTLSAGIHIIVSVVVVAIAPSFHNLGSNDGIDLFTFDPGGGLACCDSEERRM